MIPLFYGNWEGFLQIGLNFIGLRAWSLETCVAGRVVCCLSCLGMVSELFEGPLYRSCPHITMEEVMWQAGREEVIQIISSGGYLDNLLGRLCEF